jgi:regulator of protease activity HflC (stomatin/prohibitin superfamily)
MQGNITIWLEILGGVVALLFLAGIRIVRPTRRGLIERLGKYHHFANSGFHWIIPVIDKLYPVNITEQLVNADPQEIITNDNLNAMVDAQIYYKVKADETSVKNSQYNVNDVNFQIVNLSRSTLRNIIGTMSLKSANSERGRINNAKIIVPAGQQLVNVIGDLAGIMPHNGKPDGGMYGRE